MTWFLAKNDVKFEFLNVYSLSLQKNNYAMYTLTWKKKTVYVIVVLNKITTYHIAIIKY